MGTRIFRVMEQMGSGERCYVVAGSQVMVGEMKKGRDKSRRAKRWGMLGERREGGDGSWE